jgi:hypothetical protein
LVNSSIESVPSPAVSGAATARKEAAISSGRLIVNADDWGRNQETTQRTLECVQCGAVSSVSAMVFTEDSERAAALAREHGVDAGLHLNFTSPFLSTDCPTRLLEHQQAVSRHLTRNPFARGVYNPWLVRSFEYVVAAQIEEYVRLYGAAPERLDGHHHMHLSANVLLGGLLPHRTILRRHFSYESREKPLRHRVFRRVTDALLKGHFQLADYFFPLIPLEPAARLREIFQLGSRAVVEVETHPVNPGEYQFLAGGEIFRLAGDSPIARSYEIPKLSSNQ